MFTISGSNLKVKMYSHKLSLSVLPSLYPRPPDSKSSKIKFCVRLRDISKICSSTYWLDVYVELMFLWVRGADALHGFEKLGVRQVEVRERQHDRRVCNSHHIQQPEY